LEVQSGVCPQILQLCPCRLIPRAPNSRARLRRSGFSSLATSHNPGGSPEVGSGESQALACLVVSRSIGISPEIEEISKPSAFKTGDGGSRMAESTRKSDEVRVSRAWVELKAMMTVRLTQMSCKFTCYKCLVFQSGRPSGYQRSAFTQSRWKVFCLGTLLSPICTGDEVTFLRAHSFPVFEQAIVPILIFALPPTPRNPHCPGHQR